METKSDPYKNVIKRILTDVLTAKHATEDCFIGAKVIDDENLRSEVVGHLELAINLLENAYKLGLVTLKVVYDQLCSFVCMLV